MQPAIVDTYYAQVPSSLHDDQGKIFPCDTVLPDFGFGIGSTMLTIPGSLLNYTPVPGTPCKASPLIDIVSHGLY